MGCNKTEVKGLTNEIILCFTVQEEDRFLCKISGSLFACFYMVVACITMYCQISKTGRKRVNDKLHNYALRLVSFTSS